MTRPHHQLFNAAASKGAATLGVVATTTLVAMGSTPAFAIDINAEPGLITETVATRDRLKYYDNIKIYGAEAVGERPRVYAMPDGVRVGSFMTSPWIEDTGVYDTNIFGAAQDPVADWRNELKASLTAASQFPRHQLIFNVDAGQYNYLNNQDQNHTDGSAHIRGALDIDHANIWAASLHTELKHEDRSSSTAARDAAEPVPVWRNSISTGWTHDAGKLYGTISATAETNNFFSVKAKDGSTLDQDFRDQEMYSGTLRWGYRYSPGYELIGKLRTLRTTNDGDATTDRDATGYEALMGLSFETSPLLNWQVIAGYGLRDYDRTDLDTFATYLLEGRVRWLPTQRLSLYATGRRTIDDALGAEDGGRINTALELRAEYEIYHDLVGVLTAGISQSEYIGLEREDLNYAAGAELQYFYTKNMLFTAGYEFKMRDSNLADTDMDRHQFRLGGRLRF